MKFLLFGTRRGDLEITAAGEVKSARAQRLLVKRHGALDLVVADHLAAARRPLGEAEHVADGEPAVGILVSEVERDRTQRDPEERRLGDCRRRLRGGRGRRYPVPGHDRHPTRVGRGNDRTVGDAAPDDERPDSGRDEGTFHGPSPLGPPLYSRRPKAPVPHEPTLARANRAGVIRATGGNREIAGIGAPAPPCRPPPRRIGPAQPSPDDR